MKKLLLGLVITLAGLGAGLCILSSPVKADFNQNNVMSDSVFDNSITMSAAQINSWLNSNWPNSCISTNNGFSAPDPSGYNPSAGFIYGGNVSAGQVISDAANAYGLNPQVILATLEKESSVVTGNASYHCQYINTAMGFDCPDSGSCPVNPATESGFSQQIIHAAWLLKYSEQRSEGNVSFDVQKPGWDNSDDPPSCYSHLMTQGDRARSTSSAPCPSGGPPGNQIFAYDGYTTIDGTTVHLDTGATAALYDYTPHFHGNQLFVSIFEQTFDFGSTQAIPGNWQVISQGVYTDSARTVSANPGVLSPNTTYYVQLKALNQGNTTWTNSGSNPVLLATSNPGNRSSAFCDNTWWSNCSRATAMVESSVAPGQTGTFNFSIKTPGTSGTYNEFFNLVSEGNMWMRDIGLYWSFGVRGPTYAWQPVSQVLYADSGRTRPLNSSILAPNTTYYLQLSATNVGNTTWTNSGSNPVRLGTSSPTDRTSAFCDNSWVSCNRAATLDQASVAPGQTGTFSFWMQAPYTTNGTTLNEHFQPVVEGSMWMNDLGAYWPITMQSSPTAWQYLGQSSYSDSAHSNPVDLTNASTNTTYYLELRAKNSSGITWTNSGSNPLRLGTLNNQASDLCDNDWIGSGCNRAAVLKESSVAPGQTATFDFSIKTPANPVTENLALQPVIDGQNWLDNIGLYWPVSTH